MTSPATPSSTLSTPLTSAASVVSAAASYVSGFVLGHSTATLSQDRIKQIALEKLACCPMYFAMRLIVLKLSSAIRPLKGGDGKMYFFIGEDGKVSINPTKPFTPSSVLEQEISLKLEGHMVKCLKWLPPINENLRVIYKEVIDALSLLREQEALVAERVSVSVRRYTATGQVIDKIIFFIQSVLDKPTEEDALRTINNKDRELFNLQVPLSDDVEDTNEKRLQTFVRNYWDDTTIQAYASLITLAQKKPERIESLCASLRDLLRPRPPEFYKFNNELQELIQKKLLQQQIRRRETAPVSILVTQAAEANPTSVAPSPVPSATSGTVPTPGGQAVSGGVVPAPTPASAATTTPASNPTRPQSTASTSSMTSGIATIQVGRTVGAPRTSQQSQGVASV